MTLMVVFSYLHTYLSSLSHFKRTEEKMSLKKITVHSQANLFLHCRKDEMHLHIGQVSLIDDVMRIYACDLER